MVPINAHQFMTDLIRHLNLPVLLVARSTLGTINHTLLSLSQLRREGIDILGVVMNGPRNAINRHAIETYGRVSVLAEIEPIMVSMNIPCKKPISDISVPEAAVWEILKTETRKHHTG